MTMGTIVALEVWHGPSGDYAGWSAVQVGELWTVRRFAGSGANFVNFVDAVQPVLQAAINGLEWPLRLPAWTALDSFLSEAAARKYLVRSVREGLGGKPGWSPVYFGPLASARGLDDRPLDDLQIPAPPTVSEPAQRTFQGGDFASRWARKLEAQAAVKRLTEEEGAAKSRGMVVVRALHGPSAARLVKVPVEGFEEAGDVKHEGFIVKNGDEVALIETGSLKLAGPGSGTACAWYLRGSSGSVRIGISVSAAKT